MIDYAALGARIRQARKERDYTQEELAEMVNISLSHMSNIETGHTKVSLPILVSVARVLDVTMDYLLENEYSRRQPVTFHEMAHTLADCSPAELAYLLEAVKSLKAIRRRHYPTPTDKR